MEDCIYAIASEGIAAINTDSGWVGSLSTLCLEEGYWLINQCDEIEFIFDEPVSLARNVSLHDSPYPYHQSSMQAFYFIETIENIEIGDWILAFRDDKVIGARQWQGNMIDVPAMGNDGSNFTTGYINTGEIPQFKLLSNDGFTKLKGDVPAWSNNELFIVSNLSPAIVSPISFSLKSSYPNPFNPRTNINISLAEDVYVILEIYDINGRLVTSLNDNILHSGYHSVVWNATSHASGIYIVKMVAGEFVSTQKLMLSK